MKPLLDVVGNLVSSLDGVTGQLTGMLNTDGLTSSVSSLLRGLLATVDSLLAQINTTVRNLLGGLTGQLSGGQVSELLNGLLKQIEGVQNRIPNVPV